MTANTGKLAFFEIVNSNLYTPYLTASNYDLSIRTDTVAQRLFLGTGSNANSNAGIMISSNNVNIYGNLTTSNMVVMGTLTACNVEYVMSNITIYNNETVNSNLTVSGIVTCGSNLTIGGGLALSNTTGIVNISSSGSYLGVGKTPAYNLDVNGNVNFTGALTQNGVAFTSGGGSQWTSSGANVYVGSGSNVGIGKNPAYALDVVGNVNMTGNLTTGGIQYLSFSQNILPCYFPPTALSSISQTTGQIINNISYFITTSGNQYNNTVGLYSIFSPTPLGPATLTGWGGSGGVWNGYQNGTSLPTKGSAINCQGIIGGGFTMALNPGVTMTGYTIQIYYTNTLTYYIYGSFDGINWGSQLNKLENITVTLNGNQQYTFPFKVANQTPFSYYAVVFVTVSAGGDFVLNNFSFIGNGSVNSINVNGTLTKTAGSFDISHPTPNKASLGYRLRHCFVESPTRGDNIYRFKVEATVDNYIETIKLDDYWHDLNENPQVWVTRNDGFGHGYGIMDATLSTLAVNCERAGNYDVLLIGTRKDQDAIDFFDNSGGVEYIKH